MGKANTSILIMQDNGKVRHLKATSNSMRNLVIFTIFFSFLFLISHYGFFYLLLDTMEMKEKNKQIVKEINLVKMNKRKVKSALRNAKRKLALEQAKAKEQKEMGPTDSMSRGEIREGFKEVGIRDFRLAHSQNKSRLDVRFTVFNKKPNHRVMNGQIIMIASKETEKPYSYVSYPQGLMRWGEPLNPNKGHRFTIRSFKQIKGYFERPSKDICFDKVSVFLYSLEGILLLKEKFAIDEILCKEKMATLTKYRSVR